MKNERLWNLFALAGLGAIFGALLAPACGAECEAKFTLGGGVAGLVVAMIVNTIWYRSIKKCPTRPAQPRST